ncbi:MAG: antiviral reverse transcriptase Drt3a [Scrofimicrobium sp.]
MTSAPYSLRSFKAIAERESRRGKDLSRTVPAVKGAVKALQDRRDLYKAEVVGLAVGSPAYLATQKQYREERAQLRKNRDDALEAALQDALIEFEAALTSGHFSFGLKEAVTLGSRQTYQIEDDLAVSFPTKQAATVIRQLRPAGGQSRNGIVRALKEALGKKYSHAIYRLDIAKFFASIPQEKLLDRLHSEKTLDTVTAFLVAQLLEEFAVIVGERKGVPQGVSMSSHLADFYLHEFDSRMKAAHGVLFYARYVDDIVLVLENDAALESVEHDIDAELEELGLTKNLDKVQSIVTEPNGNYTAEAALEYLGYRFTRSNGSLTTGLTSKRHARRKARLAATFQIWLDSSPDPSAPNHGHDGMLIDRLRYLAGNTKLLNSKDNVAIGLFFSNSALDEGAQELIDLDEMVEQFRHNHVDKMSTPLQQKLERISFVDMFAQRPFYRFSQRKVQRIVQAWEEPVS